MNNKKYTIKYIGDRIRQKNQEKEFSNSNLINYNNKNIIPINNFNDIYNKSSSYLNKVNIASKNENNKNKNNRKTSTQNFKKINIIEKEKENKDINEYKINNLSSSYNNNYTNIKTDKIVFIDLKNNDNLNNLMDNENQNENIKHRKTSKKKLVKKISGGRENNIRSTTNLISLKKRNLKSIYSSNISKNLNKRYKSNKTNSLNRKAPKFFSSQELKMFKDKNIKKIKSIKKSDKRKSKNVNDNSIIELLYELK